MLKSAVAALAAVLVFTPTAATTHGALINWEIPAAQTAPAPDSLQLPSAPVSISNAAPAPAAAAIEAGHNHDDTRPGLAPGQTKADYYAWLARSPANAEKVRAFRTHLAARGLEDVVPVWQLIRTSSSWRECGADRFEVAPADKWNNIVETLAFVRDEVQPKIGRVEALSVYRNESLNRCSHGAPQSAHRMFFALDLTPVAGNVTRATMIRGICAAHAQHGRQYDTGLGFYSGMRFHVDSSGFRKWGPNGKGATSPCVTGSYA
ncbi:MAG TPA: hypothetical protein VIT45_08470 [Allosphingosinicella sp.]